MNRRRIKPPEPGKQLYNNLFIRRDRGGMLVLLSEGFAAVTANADRLIQDVILLVDEKRYGSASFLLATANEEMAKAYIIINMCRLDFSRHQSALRCLCRAFYSHVAKHAYNEVVRFSDFHNMAHVKEVWDVQITRWWPSSYGSGDPELPHDTYFSREMPLYVDFIDQDQKWFTPQADTRKYAFEQTLAPGDDELSRSKEALERLRETSDAGLYRPDSLSILNRVFAGQYVTDKTATQQIIRLYEEVAQWIGSELGILQERFYKSALHEWPLYHFVAQGF